MKKSETMTKGDRNNKRHHVYASRVEPEQGNNIDCSAVENHSISNGFDRYNVIYNAEPEGDTISTIGSNTPFEESLDDMIENQSEFHNNKQQ